MIAPAKIVRRMRGDLASKPPEAFYDIVHLADDEWDNQTMEIVADEWFRKHQDCHFVQVVEHAGWYLGFRRDGSIWSTANDMARIEGPRPTAGPRLVCRRQENTIHNLTAEVE